jgi:hypothetical protein
MKYLGTLDHPIAKMITDSSKKGEVVVIEISPKFFLLGIMVKCKYNLRQIIFLYISEQLGNQ